MEYEKTLRQGEVRAKVRTSSDEPAEGANGDHVTDGVETLEHHVGPEVYQELLAVFLGHLSVQLGVLHNAAAIGDIAAARYVAHQINGNALGFGAVHLDELADRLLLLGHDQGELLQPLVDEIDKEVGQLQAVAAG